MPRPGPIEKIAIISDIHSNIEALDAVLADIKQKGIDKIICAGDIVGYATSANECCERIKSHSITTIQGNHDANIDLKNLELFNPDAQAALKWTAKNISNPNKSWLLDLPKTYSENIGGKQIFMVHGSPADPLYEYMVPETPREKLREQINATKCDILIAGHTHLPYVRKIYDKLFINAGSVGQPRDGNPKACWVLLEPKTLNATMQRVRYNIDGPAQKILKKDLPKSLAERLYQGL